MKELRQGGRDLDRAADQRLNDGVEFRGMGGGDDGPCSRGTIDAQVLQRMNGRRSVRTEELSEAFEPRTDRGANLFIAN